MYRKEVLVTKSPKTKLPILEDGAIENCQKERRFKILSDDFESAIVQLVEEIANLNVIFALVLRDDEDAKSCEDQCEQLQPTRAALEVWVIEQISAVKSCIKRIQSYKDRCVL
jgi:hypothetical protein